ncbi:MAG: hypothetical protein GX786_04080 [Clostridiales bacterium]|nr:hypothetical protein [Clostridiales bacterium]
MTITKEGIQYIFHFEPEDGDILQAVADVKEEMGDKIKTVTSVDVRLKELERGTQLLRYLVHKQKFDRIRRITGYKEAIQRHLSDRDAFTDIYNRAYEAVYHAIMDCCPKGEYDDIRQKMKNSAK